MPKFLTTSGITFHLEGLIKAAKEKLILISPFLKVNERLRQLSRRIVKVSVGVTPAADARLSRNVR